MRTDCTFQSVIQIQSLITLALLMSRHGNSGLGAAF